MTTETKDATKVDALLIGHLRGGQVSGIADRGAALVWEGAYQRLLALGMGSRTEVDPDTLAQCRHQRCRDAGVIGWQSSEAVKAHEIAERKRIETMIEKAESSEREAKSNREEAERLHDQAETVAKSSSGFAQIQHERDSQKHMKRSDTAAEEGEKLRAEIAYRQEDIDD